MPSPDLTPFIDLSLNDETAQTLFETSKDLFQSRVPQWIPREANLEVVLMEALSVQLAELVYAINRVPNNVVQALVELQGLERDAGAAPTVTLEFTMVDDAGYTVLAGTQVLLTSGDELLTFTTDTDLVIAASATTGTVAATGDEFTEAFNGILTADLSMVDGLIYVDSVALDDAITGGRGPESDEDFFARATALFQRMTTTLILPSHFTAYALGTAGVYRATTIDNWDPDDSGSVPGATGGHVTVVVYDEEGPVAGAVKTALQEEMDAASVANLEVHVEDAVINIVNVAVTVKALPDAESAAVEDAVTAALESYLSVATWDWSDEVLRNNLIAVITYAEGVSHVVTLTTPAADVSFTTYGNLVELGTCTVTVT